MEHLGDTYRQELYALKGAKIAPGYQNSLFFSHSQKSLMKKDNIFFHSKNQIDKTIYEKSRHTTLQQNLKMEN